MPGTAPLALQTAGPGHTPGLQGSNTVAQLQVRASSVRGPGAPGTALGVCGGVWHGGPAGSSRKEASGVLGTSGLVPGEGQTGPSTFHPAHTPPWPWPGPPTGPLWERGLNPGRGKQQGAGPGARRWLSREGQSLGRTEVTSHRETQARAGAGVTRHGRTRGGPS